MTRLHAFLLFFFFFLKETCRDCRARRPESNYIKVPLCVSASDWPLRKQKENATHGSFRKVYIVDLMGIDHALFFYLRRRGDCGQEIYRLLSLHVRGSAGATGPSSIRARSHQDPLHLVLLRQPPASSCVTKQSFAFAPVFLPLRRCRGARGESAGRAPPLCDRGVRESGRGPLVETHAQIDKHTYGVSHKAAERE